MGIKEVIMAAIIILIAATLIGVVVTQQYALTNVKTSADESIDISGGRNTTLGNMQVWGSNFTLDYNALGWKADVSSCLLDAIRFGNSTITAWTENTDYKIWDSGTLTVYNTTTTWRNTGTNTTYITYTYCPEDYMSQGWGRSILNMLGGFLALIALALVIYYMYNVLNLKE